MFDNQDQDRIADREDRLRFESNLQAIFSYGSISPSMYIQSRSVVPPVLHPGKCNPAPSDAPVQYFDHTACHHTVPVDRPSQLHIRSFHTSSMMQYNDSPFMTMPTKFNHCSKFKYNLEMSAVLTSDNLTSLELFIDSIKSALDVTMRVHY
jgi:hypothetical protein